MAVSCFQLGGQRALGAPNPAPPGTGQAPTPPSFSTKTSRVPHTFPLNKQDQTFSITQQPWQREQVPRARFHKVFLLEIP